MIDKYMHTHTKIYTYISDIARLPNPRSGDSQGQETLYILYIQIYLYMYVFIDLYICIYLYLRTKHTNLPKNTIIFLHPRSGEDQGLEHF